MWEKIIESLQLLGLNCDGDAEDPMSVSKRIYILPTNLAIIQIYQFVYHCQSYLKSDFFRHYSLIK